MSPPPARPGQEQPLSFEGIDKASQILEKLVEDFPEVPDYRYDLSETYAKVDPGRAFRFGPSRTEEESARALESLRKALKISEALVADHPHVPIYAMSQVHLHRLLADLLRQDRWIEEETRLDEAETHLRRAMDLQATLARRHPEVPLYRVGKAEAALSLADFLRKRDRARDALVLLEDSDSLLEDLLERSRPDAPHLMPLRWVLSRDLNAMAEVLTELGQKEKAEEIRRKEERLCPPQRGHGGRQRGEGGKPSGRPSSPE